MTRTAKTALVSPVVFVVGLFLGFVSGAIGICGNGGWGLVSALIGLAALPVFVISILMLAFRFVRNKF